MAGNLIIVSKVKSLVKDAGLRTGGDFIDALSSRISQIIQAAIDKVKADGKKKTLGVEDL